MGLPDKEITILVKWRGIIFALINNLIIPEKGNFSAGNAFLVY